MSSTRWPWRPFHLTFSLLLLLLATSAFRLPAPDSSVKITSVRQGEFTLLPACELPAVKDYKSRGWNWTHNDMQILSPSQFIIPHPHNGSLTVQAQLADFNSTYQCEAYVVLANETVVKGQTKVHFIIPIVAAFLTNPPTNRSVRWGAYYTFPCDAGGTDVILERRLNGQIVRGRRVRITNDSSVECRAYNNVSDMVEKAYLTIIPESRQDDLTNFLSEPDQCQPHDVVLPSDSPCTTYLGSFAARQGHSYLIRNASLARLATLNRKIDELFRAWNVLVFGEEKTGNASEGLPSSPSDCLSNAKMLTCLLTFPPCMETQEVEDGGNGQEISYGRLKKRSIQQTEEVRLCRQHCLVITSLMCAAPFGQTANQAPLAHLFTRPESGLGNVVAGGHFQTGWMQLLRVHHQAGLNLLTSPREQAILSANLTHARAVEMVCGGLPSMEEDDERCLPVDFEAAMSPVHPNTCGTSDNSSQATHIDGDCYVDRGQDYRGPAIASPNCLSWEEVDHFLPVEEDLASEERDGMSTGGLHSSTSSIGWLGLFTLTPTLFPETLGSSDPYAMPSEAPATCRNPLGLAPQPFCLAMQALDPGPSTFQLVPLACAQLPSCAQLLMHALTTEAPLTNTDVDGVGSLFHSASVRIFLLIGIVGVTLVIFCLAYAIQVRLDKRDPPGKVLAVSQVTGPSQARRLVLLQRRRLLHRAPCPLRCLLFPLLRADRRRVSSKAHHHAAAAASSSSKTAGGTVGSGSCFPCGRSKTAKKDNLPTPLSTRIFDSVDEEDEEFAALTASMNVPVRQSAEIPHALPTCFPPASFNGGGAGDGVDGGGPPPAEQGGSSYALAARSTQLSDQSVYSEQQVLGSRSGAAAGVAAAAFEVDTYYNVEAVGNVLNPKLKSLAYPRKLLIEIRPIAQRAFGTVILARAPNLPDSVSHSPSEAVQSAAEPLVSPATSSPLVVIKTLHFNADPVAQFSFLREAEMLVGFNHPNILKVLGMCVPLQPLTVVCEYMPRGDLNSCLRRLKAAHDSGGREEGALSVDRLLCIAVDITEAMMYLGYKSYVHRDLATRSCLVAMDWTAKLSDFSMCRLVDRSTDLVDTGVSALPVRWLPLESLVDGIFHFDTDVWSFGVFLWELFTFGAVPFEDASIFDVIGGLRNGQRLPCPDGCPPAIHELMLQCWSADRPQRPSFLQINKNLTSLLAAK